MKKHVEKITSSKAKKSLTNQSKKDQVIALLSKKDGLYISELIKITGWQAHSIRGFISGTLRKKLNLNVISETSSNGSRKYKIATEA